MITLVSCRGDDQRLVMLYRQVVTEKRIVKLRKRPLKTTEFIPALATLQPVMRWALWFDHLFVFTSSRDRLNVFT